MDQLIGIGPFARLSGLSVKTLRHYDAVGVLQPVRVDPRSGYRYYDMAQCSRARAIRALRRTGLPLGDVVRALEGDVDVVVTHLRRLEAQLCDGQRWLAGTAARMPAGPPHSSSARVSA
jgi:DNA-binding transcriptional MerR regulator